MGASPREFEPRRYHLFTEYFSQNFRKLQLLAYDANIRAGQVLEHLRNEG